MAKKDLILDEYEEEEEYDFDYDYGSNKEVDYKNDYDYEYDYEEFIDDNYNEEKYASYDTQEVKENKVEVKKAVKKSNKIYGENPDFDVELSDKAIDLISLINLFSNWFGKIGMGIAVILILVFLLTGQFTSLIIYLLVLGGSFVFGYCFMYLLFKITSNN